MPRCIRAALASCLLLAALAAPTVAFAGTHHATRHVVDCSSGADLQGAIDAALPGSTLAVRGRCVGNFIIDKDLSLVGCPKAILDGHGSGTVLTIPAAGLSTGATVSISDIRISGGNPAGIENWGQLTLQDSTVSGNTGVGIANNGDFGGVTVALLRSAVRDNIGDGIRSILGHLTLQHSTVSGNSGSGALAFDAFFELVRSKVSRNGGDGIVASSQGVFTLDHSTVRGNGGRGIAIPNGSVVVDDSTVSDNTGGGIYTGVLSYLTMRHSLVIGNSADFGGGIYMATHEPDKEVRVEDSIIIGNTATTSGGGVYFEGSLAGDVFTRVKIRNNAAGVSGGGLYMAGGSLAMTDVVLRHNTPDNCFGC